MGVDAPSSAAPLTTGPFRFRRDIEGLRAVAVLLVVLFHARVPVISGGYVGVDVFYVISGFVITMVLLRSHARTGTIALVDFFARRARRLLPAALLVLAVTVLASWWWMPLQMRWIAMQAMASAVYLVNVLLARNSIDYFDTMRRESPLEHFWSLAVEEQFYLVWPLLILGLVVRLGRAPTDRLVLGILTAASVISFGLGAWLTTFLPGYAYFLSPSRAWEFAAGGLLALVAARLAGIPERVAAAITWAGLAAIIAAGMLFDRSTPFPGVAALLPVAGAVLVIAGGCATPVGGAERVLAARSLQWIGRRSYAWYLWHWPFLLFGIALIGRGGPLWHDLALAAASLIAAALTYRFVEVPLRHPARLESRPWTTLAVAAAASAGVVVLAFAAMRITPALVGQGAPVDTAATIDSATSNEDDVRALVASSLAMVPVPSNLAPSLLQAGADIPSVFHDGCVVLKITDVRSTHPCVYGDPNGRETVVLLGDSHAGSWFPALHEIAVRRGWRLLVRVKGFCHAAQVRFRLDSVNRPYDECVEFRRAALEEIARLKPTLVVTTSTNFRFGDPVDESADRDRVWTDGWTSTLTALTTHADDVVLISDTPWLAATVLDCLALHLDDSRACQTPLDEAMLEPRRRAMIEDAARQLGVLVVDPTPWFCSSTACPAIIGNVVPLRDGNHISATYSRLLWRALDARLATVRGPRP